MSRKRCSALLSLLLLLAGCSSLLPSEHVVTHSAFSDYLDAEARFAKAVPGKTHKAQLFALGFDPVLEGNGRMLSFLDVRLLFVQPNIPIDYLPAGLLQCLDAKERCIGYAFDFSKTDTQRVGSFWADAFNFRKHRKVNGWAFSAVFVLVDDLLVHKVSSGQPNIRRDEDKHNPLGPLQGAGEFFSDQLK